jgi:hypothetical protein
MNKSSTTRLKGSYRLLRVLLFCLVFVALADPADSLTRLKVPLFVSVMAVWLFRRVRNRIGARGSIHQKTRYGLWLTVFVVAILVPSIATLVGFLDVDVHSGGAPLSLAKSFLFFSIAPVIASEESDLILIIIRLSFVVALITIAMVVVSWIWPAPFLLITDFLMSRQTAIITPDRDVTGVAVGEFYYASCPLLIFSFAYHLDRALSNEKVRKWDIFLSMVAGTALLLSGARADILAVLLLLFILALRHMLRRRGWVPTLILGSSLLIAGAAAIIPKFANPAEGSNAIKLKHIHSYAREFNDRPASLLWGEGANSAFYSEGFQSWTTVTEVTYMELIRVFGLPVAILFTSWLAWLDYSLFRRGLIAIALAYIAYLAIAASNPLLINSTGFLVIASMYEQATKSRPPTSRTRLRFKLWGRTRDETLRLEC